MSLGAFKDYPIQYEAMFKYPISPTIGDALHEQAINQFKSLSKVSKQAAIMQDQKSGIKHDSSKLRYELTDPLAIQGLVRVLDFGAQKYAVDNWRKGFPYSRLISSLERHLAAFKSGEDTDPESGLPHIDHIGANWMFLSFLTKTRLDLDDRWYKHNNIRLNHEPTTVDPKTTG
jgi:Domain of unknown function (DUF5664)